MTITWLEMVLALLLVGIAACVLGLRFGFRDLGAGGDD